MLFRQHSGYWVAVGNVAQDETDPAVSSRIHAKIGRCRFQAFNDYGSRFGFAPGYIVHVPGVCADVASRSTTGGGSAFTYGCPPSRISTGCIVLAA